MSVIRWLIAVPVIALLVFFALANPDPVEVDLIPFTQSSALPLYFVMLLFMALGFLLGALVLWIGLWPKLHERRAQRKTISKLEKDLNASNEKLIAELSRRDANMHSTPTYSTLPDNRDL